MLNIMTREPAVLRSGYSISKGFAVSVAADKVIFGLGEYYYGNVKKTFAGGCIRVLQAGLTYGVDAFGQLRQDATLLQIFRTVAQAGGFGVVPMFAAATAYTGDVDYQYLIEHVVVGIDGTNCLLTPISTLFKVNGVFSAIWFKGAMLNSAPVEVPLSLVTAAPVAGQYQADAPCLEWQVLSHQSAAD